MFAAWLAILLLPLFVLGTELEPQRYVFSEDELNDINKRMGEIDKSWNLNHPAVLEFLERLYLHPELAEQPASAFLNPQPKAKRRRKRQPPQAASLEAETSLSLCRSLRNRPTRLMTVTTA